MPVINRFLTFASLVLMTLFTFPACAQESEPESIAIEAGHDHSLLVFTKTEGWRHDSIDEGVEAVKMLAGENGFDITHTEDSEYFTFENLSRYDAVLFLNTTLTLFNEEQRESFKRYIQSGGGFAGVHSASDTEYDWPWYGELVGAWFDNHPNNPNVREAVLDVLDTSHPATAGLPERWQRADEWYNFGYMNDEVHVLITLDTESYEGSDHDGYHPVAWYHEFDGGRAFYTALGHTKESYSEPLFLEHLLGGLRYAMDLQHEGN